ncbi:MAG: ergothioneine biosynthesis protein EgtB, partial [Xanthomonadaceae bacterium]|nr:ergothioneine biosynthesis protein EgtB [Xanthomonadaceae bacterium]
MSNQTHQASDSSKDPAGDPAFLTDWYRIVRADTENQVESLSPEEQNLQSMPDVSPAKWHRAHTSWFFETFVLDVFSKNYKCFNPHFRQLFNSYYNGVGEQFPRSLRSLIACPDAATITGYRQSVDQSMVDLIQSCDASRLQQIRPLVVLGLHHEQQHQELMLTDLKHAFHFNPMARPLGTGHLTSKHGDHALDWVHYPAGIKEIGAGKGEFFCFDNETPRHKVVLNRDFKLANRPVSNGDWLEFIDDGAYRNPLLWLADGWAWVQRQNPEAPLYWRSVDGGWQQFTLAGWRAVDPAEPACHINFYEAAAFAEWADARLPTEAEWETAAAGQPVAGHFASSRRFHPRPPA